jgi:hypothetical protein
LAGRFTGKTPGHFPPCHNRAFDTQFGSNDMGNHTQRSNKEPKKQPLRTAKEKRAVRHAKKHADDHPPLIAKKA